MRSLDSDEVRFLLWIALGIGITLSILSDFSAFSVSLLSLVLLALAFSLAAYPHDLRIKYELVVAKARVYRGRIGLLQHFQFWTILLFFMLFGFALVWEAYHLAHHFSPPRKFLFREIYQVFGANSYILLTASFGTYIVGVVIEIVIGSQVENTNET